MKKLSLLVLLACVMLACAPKTSKSVASTSPGNTGASTAGKTDEVSATPAGPSATNGPGDAELTAAKSKFADATMAQLQKGHSIYYGACTKCHGAANITKGTEQKWAHVLEEMAPKANLSADEKEAVWRYIMSVKLAAK